MEPTAEDWLEREDECDRPGRLQRLRWLAEHNPSGEGFLLSGGWISMRLLEEAKYCFVYGQYVATITLGVTFVVRLLAAELYTTGRKDLALAGGKAVLDEALKCGLVTQTDFEHLDRVLGLRNSLIDFRRPFAPDTVDRRAGVSDKQPEQIVEADARDVMERVFRFLKKVAV